MARLCRGARRGKSSLKNSLVSVSLDKPGGRPWSVAGADDDKGPRGSIPFAPLPSKRRFIAVDGSWGPPLHDLDDKMRTEQWLRREERRIGEPASFLAVPHTFWGAEWLGLLSEWLETLDEAIAYVVAKNREAVEGRNKLGRATMMHGKWWGVLEVGKALPAGIGFISHMEGGRLGALQVQTEFPVRPVTHSTATLRKYAIEKGVLDG